MSETAPEGESDEVGGGLSRRQLLGGVVGIAALGGVAALVASQRGADPAPSPSASTLPPPAGTEIAYGPDPIQVAELHLPAGHGAGAAAVPVVALIHGGFWRSEFNRALMDPLVAPALDRGWAVWNVDHRSSDDGGGWPASFTDVASAIDELAVIAERHALDLGRVAVVGHSAGGTLALWAAGRSALPSGAPGGDPVVRPVAAVSLAGLTSLTAAWIDDLGRGAVDALMGGPPEGEREADYLLASPSDLLPLGAAQLLIHGAEDPIVPPRQSTAHAARARAAGDPVTLRVLDRTGHFEVIEPDGRAWRSTLSWLSARLA